MEKKAIINMVQEVFAGRDPIAEAQATMQEMDQNELRTLVFIAANRIGLLLKGNDYEDEIEGTILFCRGIEIIFSAYNEACFNHAATKTPMGNA